MTAFQSGEIVDITIKGVRMGERSHIRVTIEDEVSLWVLPPQAEITRVAPAEWPPRPGDIWGGPENTRWFAAKYFGDFDDANDFAGCNGDGWRVDLVPMETGPYGDSQGRPDDVLRTHGPLALVHREDEQDGSGS